MGYKACIICQQSICYYRPTCKYDNLVMTHSIFQKQLALLNMNTIQYMYYILLCCLNATLFRSYTCCIYFCLALHIGTRETYLLHWSNNWWGTSKTEPSCLYPDACWPYNISKLWICGMYDLILCSFPNKSLTVCYTEFSIFCIVYAPLLFSKVNIIQ